MLGGTATERQRLSKMNALQPALLIRRLRNSPGKDRRAELLGIEDMPTPGELYELTNPTEGS